MKNHVKQNIIEAYALKFAADDYKEFKKYRFFGGMFHDYENYLFEKLAEIKEREGEYYELAVKQFSDNEIKFYNIVLEKYDETIDKCECSANTILINSDDKNKINYVFVKDTEGKITGHYNYRPKAMLDEHTNASDFIKEHKDKF